MKEKLDAYKIYLEENELAQSTINTYTRNVVRFLTYSQGKTISKNLVLSYRNILLNNNYKITSINLCIISINKFLKFCKLNDCTIKLQKHCPSQSLKNVMTTSDYHTLLNYAKQYSLTKYFCIMKTLAKTGIRISELRYITVEAVNHGTAQIYNKGKYRDIYIPKSLALSLQKYCLDNNISSGPIFLGNRLTPISRTAVWKKLKDIAISSGINPQKIYPHNFRHYFALSYMELYGNIFELADILGHSSVEVTRIYSRSTIEQKLLRLDKLGE